MNKFTDIFANFIEGFSFRQGSQDVKQVKKGAFLKAFTITLIIGLIGEYAFLIPLNLRSPQFIIYFCILLLIFNGLYFMLSQRFSKITKYSLIVIGIFRTGCGGGGNRAPCRPSFLLIRNRKTGVRFIKYLKIFTPNALPFSYGMR